MGKRGAPIGNKNAKGHPGTGRSLSSRLMGSYQPPAPQALSAAAKTFEKNLLAGKAGTPTGAISRFLGNHGFPHSRVFSSKEKVLLKELFDKQVLVKR